MEWGYLYHGEVYDTADDTRAEEQEMHTTRVDIGMRLAIDSTEYEKVGRVMDAIDTAVRHALADQGFDRAAFDFTHFNTHPCKATTMSRAVEAEIAYPDEGLRRDGEYVPGLPPVSAGPGEQF